MYTISRSKSFTDYWVLSRERDSNPQMFPSTRCCRPAPYQFGHLDTFLNICYLPKCQRTMLWERRDSNPQSRKRADLQSARLSITGYSPILKKLIYEVQTVRTLSRQPAIRHLRCFTCLLCSHHIASHEISCSSLIDFSTNTFIQDNLNYYLVSYEWLYCSYFHSTSWLLVV